MIEVAVATPFDAGEIIEIAVEEFKKRLAGLSPLNGGKQYAHFELHFNVGIKLLRAGEEAQEAKETLAWGAAAGGAVVEGEKPEYATMDEKFVSAEPNKERVERGMPLNVETSDGKGGRITKKVRVKG